MLLTLLLTTQLSGCGRSGELVEKILERTAEEVIQPAMDRAGEIVLDALEELKEAEYDMLPL